MSTMTTRHPSNTNKLRTILILGVLILGMTLIATTALRSNSLFNWTSDTLTSHLEMGVTELNVRDLEVMTAFYTDLVGLDVLTQDDTQVTLGYHQRPIIGLQATSELQPAPMGSAGLYHTAIVFESRAVLAQTLRRMLEQGASYFAGSSDHLVSEAFYFTDPEGNGLELYFDKDPEGWQWRNGQVQMGSRYIDPIEYINQYESVSAPPVKKMGHVHLRIGDIEQAKAFYVTGLGLTITSERNGALFVSDGTYHHHLGLNVWESAGAGVRQPSLGLRTVELLVATQSDLEGLKKRLTQAEIAFESDDNQVRVSDPWGNNLMIGVFESSDS